jgi:hypothetical protein
VIAVNFFVAVLIVGAGVALFFTLRERRQIRLRSQVPPGVNAATDAELVQVRDYYHLGRRMARHLDKLLAQDQTLPFMGDSHREEIRSVLNEWEELA